MNIADPRKLCSSSIVQVCGLEVTMLTLAWSIFYTPFIKDVTQEGW